MTPELGLIEGFYGRPWTIDDRKQTISALVGDGYRFYLYAPKADRFLGELWRQPHPQLMAEELVRFSNHCRFIGVRFGMGLSPRQLSLNFDKQGQQALKQKIRWLDDLGVQDLAMLFDDQMVESPGSLSEIIRNQLAIASFAAEHSSASRLLFCPGYYSDDPLLDKIFGPRPQHYLEQLGKELDPSIEVFWSGPEVCSKSIPKGHLQRVAEQLQRKPLLWDNYPVNDGPVMCQYLHLKGFVGRNLENAEVISGHGINVASQPVLTRIPALTLVESYLKGDAYCYMNAFREAASRVLGKDFAHDLGEDLFLLQDKGLDRLNDEEKACLMQRYGDIDHPAADEICRWLSGEFNFSSSQLPTR